MSIMNWSEKVIVVTGSSRGLGRELVLAFAQTGAKVVINYCHKRDSAEEVLQKALAYGSDAMLVQADVSKKDDVKKMYQKVIEKYGKVDILINNAGINNDHYVNIMSTKQWNEVIDTNLNSVFLCSRYFSKSMIKAHKGKILNIASLKGQLGSEGQSNYAASKAGIIAFSKSFAKEVGKFGVSVNVVCPGFVVTELNNSSSLKKDIAESMSTMDIKYSLSDFVNFIIFSASDLVQGISGQVFNIDSRIM